jgi:hypothetical protein
MRTLVLYSSYLGTSRAGYYNDWLEAFQSCPHFDVTARNIVPPYLKVSDPFKYRSPDGLKLRRRPTLYQFLYQAYSFCYTPLLKFLIRSGVRGDFSEILKYDLIVLLHSTNADSILPLLLLERYFKSRKGKLLMFVGNEYCLMPEKIRFINEVEVDYVASQLPEGAAKWLYSDCSNSKLLLVPHALNDKIYRPYQEHQDRPTDIGFIGDRYSYAIGDVERTKLAEYFARNSLRQKLTLDIRIGQKVRIPRDAYVRFLNSTRGTIGAESGTYYLEKTDRTLKKVEAFLSWHPNTTFEEVYEIFFKNHTNPVNGKAISSRHFEAVGTKTCQILLEGNYNGILKPNTHFISLNKDYSNVDQVLERFGDEDFVKRMTENAYEYVQDNHTHEHRVLNVWKEVS